MEELGLKKLVVFDLDGTLINSSSQIVEAVLQSRKDLGWDPADKDFLTTKIGLPAKELFCDLNLGEEEIEKGVSTFRHHLRNLKLNPRDSYQGALELLQSLRGNGQKIAVATNKPLELARRALSETGLLELIDHVVGVDGLPPKPDPAVIRACLSHFQINSSVAVMVGDRCEDMEAARAIGVSCIGVNQGAHSQAELLQAGASQVLANLSGILEKVREGWNFEHLQ